MEAGRHLLGALAGKLDSRPAFRFRSDMQDPPYDRPLALASLVRTMRDHFLDVSCGRGAHRVIGIGLMAKDPELVNMTLAHIALKVACEGCFTGPTGVHLTATVNGLAPPAFGPGVVWSISLVEQS